MTAQLHARRLLDAGPEVVDLPPLEDGRDGPMVSLRLAGVTIIGTPADMATLLDAARSKLARLYPGAAW
jgi:hypothetical protein